MAEETMADAIAVSAESWEAAAGLAVQALFETVSWGGPNPRMAARVVSMDLVTEGTEVLGYRIRLNPLRPEPNHGG